MFRTILNNFPLDHTGDYSMANRLTFAQACLFDNSELITLKPRPVKNEHAVAIEPDMRPFEQYCCKRSIMYFLCREKAGQIHFHGVMSFPNKKTYTAFQKWFNKQYGFLHRSEKGDTAGWYDYIFKDVANLEMPPVDEYIDEPMDNLNINQELLL